MDNIFIEHLWRSLKYEAVYLHELTDGFVAERIIGQWIDFYNIVRPHSALDGATPAEVSSTKLRVDMMDKAYALPTSPQAQQPQKAYSVNGGLAAWSAIGIHLNFAANLCNKVGPAQVAQHVGIFYLSQKQGRAV